MAYGMAHTHAQRLTLSAVTKAKHMSLLSMAN